MKKIFKIGIKGFDGFIGSHLIKRIPNTVLLGVNDNSDCDIVYDLAAYGNLAHHKDIEEIYNANLMRVIRFLKDFRGKYVYFSTSSVKLPIKTPYALSKLAAEEFIKRNHKNYLIVRPYTVIGVGEHKEHLIPKLIDSCLNGTEIPFVSEPVHDFINVEDFIDALLKAKNGICEIGTGVGTSNQEIKDIVEKVTGKKANVRVIDKMYEYDSKSWICPKGIKPKRSLEQTIMEMYEKQNN